MLRLPQVKGKYEEIAMKIKYYVERKHEDWTAQTERILPLMIKMPLLIQKDRDGQIIDDTVSMTCFCLLFFLLNLVQKSDKAE